MSAALASNLNTVVPLAANDNFTTQSRSFDYDNVGRLTSADGPLKCMEGTASYSYDAVGNLHSKSFMENGAPSRTVTNRYDTVKNRVTTGDNPPS